MIIVIFLSNKKSDYAVVKASKEATGSSQKSAANIFGSVINTGSLAILSAAVPPDADAQRRRLAAESALRGMVTAAAWSPFFVAFAMSTLTLGSAANGFSWPHGYP